jgi:riboflavin kinase/FMN adenylyltransferase
MAVVSTGFFDGVHLGHRKVLDRLCSIAAERGEESIAVTFWPHPRNVLQQNAEALRLLTGIEEKSRLITALGIGRIEVIPFTKDFSRLSAEQFMKRYLVECLGATALVLGYDHRVGNDPSLSQTDLIAKAQSLGLATERVGEYDMGGVLVSSTKIRNVLLKGDVSSANRMLGYRYALNGVVVLGNRIGRTIGFPTANMKNYEPLKVIPADGVYLVWVKTCGVIYRGICNIGRRPTVGKFEERTIETNILDFNEDIYGLDISLEFEEKVRDEVKFPSLEALSKQIARDKAYARQRMNDPSKIIFH